LGEENKLKNFKTTIIAVVLVLVVAAASYTVGVNGFFKTEKATASSVLYSEDTVNTIFENASPAVVEIDTTQKASGNFSTFAESGQGSGFLISSDGYILTNNHVVDGADSIIVKLSTGDTLQAEILGKDAVHDLALVKVDSADVDNITPLVLGNSDDIKIGAMAVAIGNPYGLDNTVTVGVISGKNRSVSDSSSSLIGMLQTDAALNPGNSGGPLLDASGAVIGINTAIETGTDGTTASGIGFAVPSNVAASVLSDLAQGKSIKRPWAGVSIRTLTDDLVNQLKLDANAGVVVVYVASGSPAEEAGVQTNDVITSIDGNKIKTVEELQVYINTRTVGDTITLKITRGSDKLDIDVTLSDRPTASIGNQMPQMPDSSGQSPFPNFQGRSGRN
jgi:serine protease Do